MVMAARPQPRRTQGERSSEMRLRLLDAAVECLHRLGYVNTTPSQIARTAGVSRGAQLHHFPKKQELLISAVGHLFSRRIRDFRTAVEEMRGSGQRPSVLPL